MYRDLAKKLLIGSLRRELARETSFRDLFVRELLEICRRHFAKGTLLESLHRDLIKRSCQERPLIEILNTDLGKRFRTEMLPGDLV